jgi:translation initiation factor 5B
MLEKAKELAVILCFDVPVDKDAERMALELGIEIFRADIIYHLFDQFTAYHAKHVEEKKAASADKAVFPCRLKTIACFAKRDRTYLLYLPASFHSSADSASPSFLDLSSFSSAIILGVDIIDGTLRIGTPLCVIKINPETKKREVIKLGQMCVFLPSPLFFPH